MDNKELFNYYLNKDVIDKCDSNNLCLISNMILEDNYINLECGHKFNYMPLYYELQYQKKKKILDNKNLKINEIKCPYCRKITSNLIPYYKYYDTNLISGVNFPEKYCMKINECSYIKNNIKCINSACKTKNGFLCNKHLIYSKFNEDILNNIDKTFYENYKKKNIKELKEELRKNNLKLIGNKKDLIERLYIDKKTKDNAAAHLQKVCLAYCNEENNNK